MLGMCFYILPPYLSIFFLFSDKIIEQHLFFEAICFLLASFFVALFGYLLNDLFDVEIDVLAKKKNIFIEANQSTKITLFLSVIIGVVILWMLSKANIKSTSLLLAEFFFLIIYSVKNIRLKNNPIFGPFCDAHYSHILPVFITLSFLNVYLKPSISVLLYSLLFVKGFRNILLHQLDDRKFDKQFGINTFPIYFGYKKTLQLLNFILFPLELIISFVFMMALFPASKIFFIAYFIYQVFSAFQFCFWIWHFIPRSHFNFKFLYYLNNFYEFWLPLICTININNSFGIVFIIISLYLIVYNRRIHQFVNDCSIIYYNFKNHKIE